MATPPSSPLDRFTPETPSNTEDFTESNNFRKRNREPSRDNFDDTFWDLTDDGRPKTRRVNPQRLAIRLGPDLVAEMEELIVPGAKMPTFAVRKDFQERYCVDRRHIYDYFHSRGLRVAKEDKHTNLIRGRAMKAQAQAQAQAQLAAKTTPVTVKQETYSYEMQENTPCLKPRGRPATGKKPPKTQDKKSRILKRSSVTLTNVRRRFLEPVSKSSPDIFDDSRSQTDATTKTSSSGTDTDWESEPPCPEFSLPCNTSKDDNLDEAGSLSASGSLSVSSSLSDFLPSPDDFIAGYFEFPSQIQDSMLELENSSSILHDFDTNADENHLMNEFERSQAYDLINNNIAPALEGFPGMYYNLTNEASNECSQLYYDQIVSVSHQSWTSGTKNTSAPVESPMPMDFPDLKKWLVDDLDLSPSILDKYDSHPACDTSYTNANNGNPSIAGSYGVNGAYSPDVFSAQSLNQHQPPSSNFEVTSSRSQGRENINSI